MRKGQRRAACVLLTALVVCTTSGSASTMWQDYQALQSAAMQGHILLLHDDCHRVLDDPSSINRYSFKTYHQYVNYCVERKLRKTVRPYIKPRLA